MGTSTGPRKTKFDKAAEVKPDQDQYDQKPRGAADHPQATRRLPLPTGSAGDQAKDGGIPKGVINPNSRHANERGKKVGYT